MDNVNWEYSFITRLFLFFSGLLADGHANGKSYGTVGHVNETLTAKSAITSDPCKYIIMCVWTRNFEISLKCRGIPYSRECKYQNL